MGDLLKPDRDRLGLASTLSSRIRPQPHLVVDIYWNAIFVDQTRDPSISIQFRRVDAQRGRQTHTTPLSPR
jgi:hypothetical protein